MIFDRGENITDCNIMVGVERVEQINEFVCLGSIFRINGSLFRIFIPLGSSTELGDLLFYDLLACNIIACLSVWVGG